MGKKDYINGAIILSISGILVKILGFAFRIPLGRMIGAGGMGDYSPAYDVYAFILVIATAGIPVAISKLVAEECAVGKNHEAENILRTSQVIMLIIGISGFLILFFGADYIADFFSMKSSAMAIKAISPTLLFAPIMASYRGYFQGLQNMKPTAASQLVEQLFRVAVGLALAWLLFKNVILCDGRGSVTESVLQSRGAAGACFGAAAGAFCGLVAILIMFKRNRLVNRITSKGESVESKKVIGKKIVIIAFPITIAACIMPIVNLADVTIVMNRLTQAGFEYNVAKSMFGELTGFAAPIMGLPQILIQAVAVGLVPLIATSNKKADNNNLQQDITLGYRTSIILAMPCAAGMFALAEPVMFLFYGDQVSNAIPCLRIYAIAFIFLSITSITTAMLQGVGKQNLPVIYLIIGLMVKIMLTWVLSGITVINVKGAAIGTGAAYMIAATLDVRALKKHAGVNIKIKSILASSIAASAIMGLISYLIYKGIFVLTGHLLISVFLSVLCGIFAYGIELIYGHIITKEDVLLMPFGDKLIHLYEKRSIKKTDVKFPKK